MPKPDADPNLAKKYRVRSLLAIAFLGANILHGDSGSTKSTPATALANRSGVTVSSSAPETSNSVPTVSPGESSKNTYGPIAIVGNEKCVTDTKAALKILQDKAPQHFKIVVENIKIIQCEPKGSGMHATELLPRFVVGDDERAAGKLWYAGTIVHDANHSRLYHQYSEQHPGKVVPEDAWTGRAAEVTCLAAQANALREIGDNQADINYVKNIINTNYWNIPLQDRYW